jgi:hypothetical protein
MASLILKGNSAEIPICLNPQQLLGWFIGKQPLDAARRNCRKIAITPTSTLGKWQGWIQSIVGADADSPTNSGYDGLQGPPPIAHKPIGTVSRDNQTSPVPLFNSVLVVMASITISKFILQNNPKELFVSFCPFPKYNPPSGKALQRMPLG